ncbi:MAG: CRISPR-associated protein Cmr3 [Planctomycetaceae bacterium]|nr:MAG: CRISPR-associated protein Cmr3 [Planctomycetaceae bacterium]
MTAVYWRLFALDALIARDGRPFGMQQGNRMRGYPWLMPSVLAGAFRTAIGRHWGQDFSNIAAQLQQIGVAGGFPVADDQLLLPAPHDAVAEPLPGDEHGRPKTLYRVQPQAMRELEGANFPFAGLRPVMLSEAQSQREFKPAKLPAWWPMNKLSEWLANSHQERYDASWFTRSFLYPPLQEVRDHVSLKPESGAAEENKIFTTANLHINLLRRYPERPEAPHTGDPVGYAQQYAEIQLALCTQIPAACASIPEDLWQPVGGEQRLVRWRRETSAEMWHCPPALRTPLASARRVRMVLATPAIFRDGWKPGWLDAQGMGCPPGCGVRLKLVGVSIERWKAVSGWSLQPLPGSNKPGPKPIRRTVPAGGVYFFEVQEGDAASLAEMWLQSVCDDDQERRDGFGLAVWGLW